jgi:hypothetical protein
VKNKYKHLLFTKIRFIFDLKLIYMAEDVIQVELGAWDWMAKIIEKMTLIRLSVIDHKEIKEEDYPLLKIFFRIWDNGEFPLYETKVDKVAETACQKDLFTPECRKEVLNELNGTIIDKLGIEPIKTEQDDKKV